MTVIREKIKYKENYYTRNRKLKLEEYDDDGNLIEVIGLDANFIINFLAGCNYGQYIDDKVVERKADREHFEGEMYDIAKEILIRYNGSDTIGSYYFNPKTINIVENIIDHYGIDTIKFVLKFYDGNNFKYDFSMEDYWKKKKETFIETLEWVKNSSGIWYAIDTKGNRGMTYLEKPTKKQAAYQRTKNGKRIVFYSFDDWKEYLVEEHDLK